MSCLNVARQLAIWFHRALGDPTFRPGPFQPPRPPADPTAALREELERLRAERDAGLCAAEREREAAEAARLTAEERARTEAEDRAFWEGCAAETEATKAAIAEQLAALQAAAAATPPAAQQAMLVQAEEAAQGIDLDEAATRALIDARLRARGWEADTQALRYSAGTRPAKGRNLAIAEWPTANGPADYALFIGTQCVAMVEAKRSRNDVMAAVDQAGRYSQGFTAAAGQERYPGGPWPAQSGPSSELPFQVPFLFATNGRGYLKQIETQSGIWFRDGRSPTNARRALTDWPTPDGLKEMLDADRERAQADLAALPYDFAFGLRDYQQRAIQAVEGALADDSRRALLLAMATGTGKTKLAIALLYRLLHTRRFRRVCFVVDRTALGEQTQREFQTTCVVSVRSGHQGPHLHHPGPGQARAVCRHARGRAASGPV